MVKRRNKFKGLVGEKRLEKTVLFLKPDLAKPKVFPKRAILHVNFMIHARSSP